MERKLIKLIDQVGVRAAELSEISNREKYTKNQNQMKLVSKDQEQTYDNDKQSVSHGKKLVAQQKLAASNLNENVGEGKDLKNLAKGIMFLDFGQKNATATATESKPAIITGNPKST